MVYLFVINVEGKFQKVYKNIQVNERGMYKLEINLGDYYPFISNQFFLYQTPLLCDVAGSHIPDYLVEECKTVLNGIMLQGLRGVISIILLDIYKMYQTYEYEKPTPSEIIEKYVNNTKSNNLCELLI